MPSTREAARRCSPAAGEQPAPPTAVQPSVPRPQYATHCCRVRHPARGDRAGAARSGPPPRARQDDHERDAGVERPRAPLRAAPPRTRRPPAAPRRPAGARQRPAPGAPVPTRRACVLGRSLRAHRLDRRRHTARGREPADRRLPGLPGRQRVEPRRLRATRSTRNSDRYIAALPRQPASRLRLGTLRRLRHPVHGRPGNQPLAADPLHRLRRRERPRPVPGAARRAASRAAATATCSSSQRGHVQALRAVRRAARGRRLERGRRARCSTCARTRCGPTGWTSADAAGLPIFPGLVRYDEVARGHIDHALRFTVAAHAAGLHRTRRATTRPASTDPSLPPMGLRFRLQRRLRHLGLPRAGARDPQGAARPTG